jgi:O-antigen/teichoic acid export membrane protein
MDVMDAQQAAPQQLAAEAPRPGRLAADSLRILSGRTIGTVATALAAIFIVRALGPTGKGGLSYATMVLTLATTAFSGVTTAAMISVARRGVDRSAAERAAFRIAIIAGAALGAILLALGLLVHSQWALAGGSLALIPALFASAIATMLQYRGDVKRALVMQQVSTTGLAVATAVVVLAGGGIVGAFACLAGTLTLSAAIGRRGLHATSPPSRVAAGIVGAVGVGTTLLAVVGYLNLTVDVYLVAALRPAAELGIYTLAIAIGEMLWNVSSAMLWPALGPIAHLDREEAARLAARICRYSVALVGAAAVVAWFVGPFVIRFAFGEPFAPTGGLLRILLPGIVAMSGKTALGSFVLLALGRTRALLAVHIASTVACAIICVVGLPRYGLAAAAFATSVTYCAVFPAVAWLAVRGGLPLRLLFRG